MASPSMLPRALFSVGYCCSCGRIFLEVHSAFVTRYTRAQSMAQDGNEMPSEDGSYKKNL